jgi:hypothetical protein
MSRDVIITPANGVINFSNFSSSRAQIALDTSNNLIISSSGGTISIGNTASNILVGDGINSVDIIFEQSGAIRALLNKTLTLGQNTSFVTTASPFNFLSPDGTKTITARMLNTDVLSFQGNAGELLSLSDTLSGSIFTVNDVSGIPSIEVMDTGLIKLAPFGGSVSFGGNTGNVGQVLISQGNTTPPRWGTVGATGGGSDQVFFENSINVASSYTITTSRNAMSAGPITVNNGVIITIPDGSSWTIV